MAPAVPVTAPFAVITSAMLRSAAPSAPSMPSARSRRRASTVNDASATRPTKISPSVAAASTMNAGLMPPEAGGVWTAAPAGKRNAATLAGVASNSTVTSAGAPT